MISMSYFQMYALDGCISPSDWPDANTEFKRMDALETSIHPGNPQSQPKRFSPLALVSPGIGSYT
jgi:hypothetical protein